MKFVLYSLLAFELVVSIAIAASVHPEALGLVSQLLSNNLDGKDVVGIVKQLESLAKQGSAPDYAVTLADELAPYTNFKEENCTLTYFNSLASLAGEYKKSNENIARFLDYCRSEQLMVCHQKDPKFSTVIAMNGNPGYLNY